MPVKEFQKNGSQFQSSDISVIKSDNKVGCTNFLGFFIGSTKCLVLQLLYTSEFDIFKFTLQPH